MTVAGGLVCLQGGAEFGAACRGMDADVLARTPIGPVVVLPAAADDPDARARTGRTAARWFGRLGADEVGVAADPLDDPAAAAAHLEQAALIALPGGSPARLLRALDGPVGHVLRDRHAAGATLWGASAGAMVLCRYTLLPDRGREVARGLDLVPGLALPHWAGTDRFEVDLPPGTPRWGLPECGGVVIVEGTVRAVGAGDPVVLVDDEARLLPREEATALPA